MISRIQLQFKQKVLLLLVVGGVFFFAFPNPLFEDPTSTVLEDKDGKLLSAQIASDGQWRFPSIDSVPSNLEAAILQFEDEYFYFHPGVNPVSLVRALWQNLNEGRVVSGASTISMQVIRLSRKGKARSIIEKLIEMYLAIRLEFSFSKQEILNMYVSHAPYGGNVVGVEAASWRYFNRPLDQLSWGEVSMLAVLPNAPALIHPGRNRAALMSKRNRLLLKLRKQAVIDSVTCALAQLEPIPEAPSALPGHAHHLLEFAIGNGKRGRRVHTTIDQYLQTNLDMRLRGHVRNLSENGVHNACAMIVSIHTGNVLAYVGNAIIPEARAPYVDIAQAPRSSGSILKPFLFARSFETGLVHSNTLLRDVPVSIGRYAPLNFDRSFEGVVQAKEALARSLNIPATLLLKDYGLVPFYSDLQELGFKTINRSVDNYGLTLILGGAEVSLWDLAKVYTNQCQNLLESTGQMDSMRFCVWQNECEPSAKLSIDPSAWWMTSEALTNVQRPGLDKDWRKFSSSRKIAWKTGTSHGFRDAWALGYDGEYLVAVWIGNADGEGRPGLTGTSTASPLMFEAFQLLPEAEWFAKPDGNFRFATFCASSGLAPNPECPTVQAEMPMNANMLEACTYHKKIQINRSAQRVLRQCAAEEVIDTIWFQLDPVAEFFYRKKNQSYQRMPNFTSECKPKEQENQLAIVYPAYGAELVIPKNFKGAFELVQFQATTDKGKTLYWHLDESYLGSTTGTHQSTQMVEAGRHELTIMDEDGNVRSCVFTVYRG